MKRALDRGLYLMTHWNVVMCCPPLTITRDELDEALDDPRRRAVRRRRVRRVCSLARPLPRRAGHDRWQCTAVEVQSTLCQSCDLRRRQRTPRPGCGVIASPRPAAAARVRRDAGPVRAGSAGSSVTRYDDGRVCVFQGAELGLGQCAERQRRTRSARCSHGRRELITPGKIVTWWIGPSARPPDVVERLRAAGLVDPADRVARAIGLALRRSSPPTSLRASRCSGSRRSTISSQRARCSGTPSRPRRNAASRADAASAPTSTSRCALGVPVGFLATLDGRTAGDRDVDPVRARASSWSAGATAAWARGRGLYRALVRARWDDAVARGTPALVTQASPKTSYPILKRLGFEDVCEIVRLEDAVQSSKTTSPAS